MITTNLHQLKTKMSRRILIKITTTTMERGNAHTNLPISVHFYLTEGKFDEKIKFHAYNAWARVFGRIAISVHLLAQMELVFSDNII